MFRKLLAGGLFAGLAAGIVAAILQMWLTVPLVLEAELYETGHLVHFPGAEGQEGASAAAAAAEKDATVAAHEQEHTDGVEGLKRNLLTLSADLVIWTGFGILLSIAISVAAARGAIPAPGWRQGLVWGLGGFVAVSLLPAMGLAPELPGSTAAPLFERQLWWTATVLASIAGLWLIAFGRSPAAALGGVVLALLPHLIGAPQPDAFGGVVPPELQGEFAARALASNAITWAVLGVLAGAYWGRSEARAA